MSWVSAIGANPNAQPYGGTIGAKLSTPPVPGTVKTSGRVRVGAWAAPFPIDRSTTWPYEDGEPGAFSYARFSSPTVAEAERALGELDGGEALLFASGAAASAAVVLALLSPGQTVALAEGAYYGTGVLLEELERWGVRHVEFDQTGPPPPEADLVWIEAPVEPVPDDAGLRGGRCTPGAGRLRLDCGDSAARETARARVRDCPPLGDQGPGRPRRRPRRRAGGRAIPRRRRGFESSVLGPARSPPPMSPGSSCEGCRPSRCASPARPRARGALAARLGDHPARRRSSAIPASGRSCRSTSPTRTPLAGSRRARG